MNAPSSAVDVRFLPLAITRVDDRYGCVGAMTDAGWWIRPEPTFLRDIQDEATPYVYFCWAKARVGPSSESDARPEDRDLAAAPQREAEMPTGARHDFLVRHLDPDIATAFSGERSLGLVRATVRRVYVMRSTGGRVFLRTEFADGASEVFDWIVPDLAFGEVVWPLVERYAFKPGRGELLADVFARVETFFCVGLTKPNNRFPGKFRGCHPLVVGVHTVPDYAPLLGENLSDPRFEPE